MFFRLRTYDVTRYSRGPRDRRMLAWLLFGSPISVGFEVDLERFILDQLQTDGRLVWNSPLTLRRKYTVKNCPERWLAATRWRWLFMRPKLAKVHWNALGKTYQYNFFRIKTIWSYFLLSDIILDSF